jgi:hypothetical protein
MSGDQMFVQYYPSFEVSVKALLTWGLRFDNKLRFATDSLQPVRRIKVSTCLESYISVPRGTVSQVAESSASLQSTLT